MTEQNIVTRTNRARALGRSTHAVFKNGVLHENHCQICNAKIAGLVPHERETTEVVNGRRVVRQLMTFAYFANYREALLTFDDGSRHVACVCVECAEKLSDPAVAEDAYAVAVSQWVSEGARVSPVLANRTGARLVRVALVIQE